MLLEIPHLLNLDQIKELYLKSSSFVWCLFQFKRVLVNSFHYKNHIGCSSSYNSSHYKEHLFEGFHTTGREQVNSRLSKIEDSFGQFSYSNYMNMLRIWFAIDNLKANDITKP